MFRCSTTRSIPKLKVGLCSSWMLTYTYDLHLISRCGVHLHLISSTRVVVAGQSCVRDGRLLLSISFRPTRSSSSPSRSSGRRSCGQSPHHSCSANEHSSNSFLANVFLVARGPLGRLFLFRRGVVPSDVGGFRCSVAVLTKHHGRRRHVT